ncbi:quinoprotein relay system zinc metallohydrolase 2 [Salipiger sp. 1_MG-2023]|uniref:quinoprotein relay system zinc metallohydrolase 2 n=1 Tax=Salipiger sp. 1_MG-2023 TaxID=3062665 RepID=UPI0026E341C0|nr:quinoprotein relay system zinc metallohydrolase 2 [Salipiger sp. 1_MG-2023]MDO6585302.1 quinoprotein relay system zinc metallohydrolase 2 [Salipiger sp. 1_MG-2023]
MFEAVLTICALSGAPCREALLPGFEAEACGAALPQGARCVPLGPALEVSEIAPGVFVHRGQVAEADAQNAGDIANLGFVLGQRSVAVIDSGGSAQVGEALWRAIRAQTDLPVSHVILTHVHPDHVLGATVFDGAQVVGRAGLARALADRGASYLQSAARLMGAAGLGTALPEVTAEVADSRVIDLGGRRLLLRAWPLAHSGTDLTVLDEASGTFFAGDLVFDGHIPALDGSLTGWQAVQAEMATLEVSRLVPGHGGPVLDWPEGGFAQAEYLRVLADETRAAIDAGERIGAAAGHVAAGQAPLWQLFDAFNRRNVTAAFSELEWD